MLEREINMQAVIKEIFQHNSAMTPRAYQYESIEENLRLFLDENYNSILLESPTGSGKTVMGIVTAVILARKLGKKRIGWVAMRRNLLTQAIEVAKSFGVEEYFYPISMFDKNPPPVDIMVVDEAHHDATMSMSVLHKKLKPIKVLGLSATPLRTDKAELIFQKSVAKAGIYELVRLGYLARPDLYVLPDWQVETVCEAYLSDVKKWGKSIIFFFTMEECQKALRIIQSSGVKAVVVHAGVDREPILQAFEAGEIDVLINMIILTEGFDSPELETVFVRPSGKALTQQMGGRVLRMAKGLRKKIVQSQDSTSPFSSLAPVGRSFKRKPDASWMALDYDPDLITKLISESNKKMGEQIARVTKDTHDVIKFFNDEKKKRTSEVEAEAEAEAD